MRRSGLTLIELLVTIGIVAALIAVLIPSLHRSRIQARATICTSNIRQLSFALGTYASDNDRFPCGFDNTPTEPPPGGYPGYHQYNRMGWWWFNYLEGLYEKNMGRWTVLQCPFKNLQHPKLKDDILCGNYGVNLTICKMSSGRARWKEFIGEPLTSIEVPRPSQTLLLVDSGYAIISWLHASDIPPVPLNNSVVEDTAYVPGLKINKDRLLWPGQNYDALYGRHPRKTVNIGYLDGHVELTRADDLLVKKSSEGYRNLVPLWCPK